MTFLKTSIKAAFLAALAGFLGACSPLAALNLLVPRGGYSLHRDIAYGSDPRQKLDLYVPDGLKEPAPVLLFLYGGRWETGTRGDYRAVGQAFASRGIVTAVADYRLYPQARFPVFVEDGAKALAFLHAHIAGYGGDPHRLFVAGHSAGAYNAVMLGSDPRYLKSAGGEMDWIKGVIGIAGPYDFLPLTDSDLIDMFHGADNKDAMPINHIDGPRPPMLLLAGSADTTVNPGNTKRMAAVLRAHGNRVQEIYYPGIGHIGIILSLMPGFRGKTSLRQDMTNFIRSP